MDRSYLYKMSFQFIFIFIWVSSILYAQNKVITLTWSELSQQKKSDILNDSKLYENAKNLYENEFHLSDDSLTFDLLDTLSNPPQKFLPLYFELFLQIVDKSDGALSEVMGLYCMRQSLNQTQYIFKELNRLTDLGKEHEILKKYADFIGYEIWFEDDPNESFEKYKDNVVQKTNILDNENKKMVDIFLKYVKDFIKKIDAN